MVKSITGHFKTLKKSSEWFSGVTELLKTGNILNKYDVRFTVLNEFGEM